MNNQQGARPVAWAKRPTLMQKYNIWYLSYVLLIIIFFLSTFFKILPDQFQLVPLTMAFAYILINAIKDILHKKFGSDLFFIIATIVALIGGERQAITIVLIILMISKYFEQIVEDRTESAIESLMGLIPTDVLVVENKQEKYIPIAQVVPGMHIIVKTGSQIPVDGIIIDGTASINEASLTGESVPKEKSSKELVFAGTFIESGSIIIEAKKIGQNTMFGKISLLLEKVNKHKAKITQFASKAAFFFTIFIIIFILIVWFITKDFSLIVTLLIFGSPLELLLATPLSMLGAIAAAYYNGILIKNGAAIETFSEVDTIVFDKTGTLTIGQPKIISITVFDTDLSKQDILKLAAIAEKRAGHVLAKAILDKAKEENIIIPDPDSYISVTGHGIEITYNKMRYLLGNRHFIEEPEHGNIPVHEFEHCKDQNIQRDESPHTTFYLACGNKLCGAICAADEIRKEAKDTIEQLKKQGVSEIILLSGDKKETVQKIAKILNISKAYGEVFPEEKLKIINQLQNEHHIVAMIGDGINDAPALKHASIGIAMGAMGMEPAIEAADIVLMNNDIRKIALLHKLAKKTMLTIKQNLIFGFIIAHLIGMILGLLRILNPIQAAFFHGISDLIIIINAARIIKFRE